MLYEYCWLTQRRKLFVHWKFTDRERFTLRMGQQASQFQVPSLTCCTERQLSFGKTKSVGGATSSTYQSPNIPDMAVRFDNAVKNKDLPELVKLLASNHRLGKDVKATQHPWAEQPTTIGALAAVHIAVLASEPSLRDRLRSAGALPVLVQYLNMTNSRDRIHSAVVALSFLTVDNDENCTEVYRAGALPLLVPLITVSPEGLGFASASVCRNLYNKNKNAREEFANLNGIQSMVYLLRYNASRATDSSYMDGIFETVSNLADLLDADSALNESDGRIVKRAAKDNLVDTLDNLAKVCLDEEVKDEASKLSKSITKYLKANTNRNS